MAVYEGTCSDITLIACGSGVTELLNIPIGSNPRQLFILLAANGVNKSIEVAETEIYGLNCDIAEEMTTSTYSVTPTSEYDSAVISCTFPPLHGKHWLKYDLVGTGNVVVVTASVNTYMAVYTGDCTGLTEQACVTGTNTTPELYLVNKPSIFIVLYSDGVNKDITVTESEVYDGLNCEKAQPMTSNPYTVTPTSTQDSITTSCTFQPTTNKHWLRYDLTGTDTNAISITSSVPTYLAVFTGDCTGLKEIACIENTNSLSQTFVGNFPAVYVAVVADSVAKDIEIVESMMPIILWEDFEGGIPLTWTVNDIAGLGNFRCIWNAPATDLTHDINGNTTIYACADSDECGSGVGLEQTEMITPILDFSICSTCTTATLEFEQYYNDIGATEDFASLDIRINGGSWTTVLFQDADSPDPDYQIIDLTAIVPSLLSETNVQLRFYYQGNYDWWWAVDNIKIQLSM
jgi:hypothetical protein